MRKSRQHLLLPALFAGAFVLSACGGGPSSDISCVPLDSFRAYRFQANSISEVKESEDPVLAASSEFPQPFRLVIESTGEVQAEDRISAVVRHGDGTAFSEGSMVMAIGDKQWSLLGENWVENERSPIAVPFIPADTCRAIAPEMQFSELTPNTEDVNGVASLHYQLQVENNFYARHINFSAGGDEARLIDTLTVDIWVAADGDYPTKILVHGTAEYPDGSDLLSEIGYEISDINATDIEIIPPA